MDLKGAEIRNIYELCMDIGSKQEMPLRVNIPYYQRPYTWKSENVKNLIDDFYKNMEEGANQEYFVGSVVLVKNARGSGRHDVIDGQQRITTVFLLNYLKLLIQRSYIEEYLLVKKTNFDSLLSNFETSYSGLFGENKKKVICEIKKRITNALDDINELDDDKKESVYEDLVKGYQSVFELPEKNITDLNDYKKKCEFKLKLALDKDELAIFYSRDSYNKRLKEALSKIIVLVDKNREPQLHSSYEPADNGKKNDNKDVVELYIDAIKTGFDVIKSYAKRKEIKSNLALAKEMYSIIDNMLKNIKFCVIMTGDEKDAYTLFEVLNDRAAELNDLDLIKNLYYREYCNKSKEADDDIIDSNIEKLDEIWGDKIFAKNVPDASLKLISYLGAVYLTGNKEIVINKVERYRDTLEKKYFDMKYIGDERYTFENVYNDINVYYMIKVILEECKLRVNKTVEGLINAEAVYNKSITYRTFHLINALKLNGVWPALSNMVIKKYLLTHNGQIDIEDFRVYFRRICDDTRYLNSDDNEIHKLAFDLWRIILCSNGHDIPRKFAVKVFENVNYDKYDISQIDVDKFIDFNELEKWTFDWKYGNDKNNAKVKVLLINLFKMDKVDNRLINKFATYSFQSPEIHLDHLEPKERDKNVLEKYFAPADKNDNREKYVNGIGNFMILDRVNNNDKDNIPLQDALAYYDNMTSTHWLIEEIKEMLENDKYSKSVSLGETNQRVPTEAFFNERVKRIQKYFKALLKMEFMDKESEIR